MLSAMALAFAATSVADAQNAPPRNAPPADGRQRERLFQVFPDLIRDPARYGAPARRMLSRAEAAILRHDMRPLC
jgi:hypothetical protein